MDGLWPRNAAELRYVGQNGATGYMWTPRQPLRYTNIKRQATAARMAMWLAHMKPEKGQLVDGCLELKRQAGLVSA